MTKIETLTGIIEVEENFNEIILRSDNEMFFATKIDRIDESEFPFTGQKIHIAKTQVAFLTRNIVCIFDYQSK